MFQGGRGSLPGQFIEPRDMARDSQGNFYITDTQNHRVQKFDADGKYIMQWGEKGDDKGEFNEPMGIDVGPDDLVFVTDTWNQRIQVFDTTGKFIRQWQDNFYGPRAIEVHQNQVYIADTGNHIIKIYTLEGRKRGSFGKNGSGKGELREPVGIAAREDRIYVCDTYNARIQIFSTSGIPIETLPFSEWNRNGPHEPYIALLEDGSFAVTETGGSRIHILDDRKERPLSISKIGKKMLTSPRGIIFSPADSSLYIVDSGNHRIVRLVLENQ